MKFYTNYDQKPVVPEIFEEPSVTVPDESMSIPEIIARFVRFGTAPVAIHSDIGDNEAFEPGFDPLDYQPQEIVDSIKPKKVEEPSKDLPKSEAPEASE